MSSEDEENPITPIKVVCIGDRGAGRPAFIERFINGTPQPARAAKVYTQSVAIDDSREVTLQLWDTRQNPQLYLPIANIILYFVDINQTLEQAKKGFRFLDKHVQSKQPKRVRRRMRHFAKRGRFLGKPVRSKKEPLLVLVATKKGVEETLSRRDIVALGKQYLCTRVYITSAEQDECVVVYPRTGKRDARMTVAELFTKLTRERAPAVLRSPSPEPASPLPDHNSLGRQLGRRWQSLLVMSALGLLAAGAISVFVLALLMCVGLIAPFAFLGFSGMLGIGVSVLFVCEAGLALMLLLLSCTPLGMTFLRNMVTYIVTHVQHPKCMLFIFSALMFGVLIAAMAPGGMLALTSLPVFTAATLLGSVVLTVFVAVVFTVLSLFAERAFANLVLFVMARGSTWLIGKDQLPSKALISKGGDTSSYARFAISVVGMAIGETSQDVISYALGDRPHHRWTPAIIAHSWQAAPDGLGAESIQSSVS